MRDRSAVLLLAVAPVFIWQAQLRADSVVFQGRVTMADGSQPPKAVAVEYDCTGRAARVVAVTGKNGAFIWIYQGTAFSAGPQATSMQLDPLDPAGQSFQLREVHLQKCSLRAVLEGYVSSVLDLTDQRLAQNPHLPDLVIRRPAGNETLEIDPQKAVPRAAAKPWGRAVKALDAHDWQQAATQLRAVCAAAPKFALGWSALSLALVNQGQMDEARVALEKSVELDPKPLPARFRLMRLDMELKDWAAAESAADALIAADTRGLYREAHLDRAVILYHRNRLDDAIASAGEEIRQDTAHELPRAEYVLGMLEAAKGDNAAAEARMREYLRLEPNAADADEVRRRIENLGKPGSGDVSDALDASNLQLAPAGETWVPGGVAALGAMAGLKDPDASNFFHEFCQAIAAQAAPEESQLIPQYYAGLRAFMTAVVELTALGVRKDQATSVVTLSLANDPARARTESALQLLGWRLARLPAGYSVEPGDQPADGLRQAIPAALGISEIAMKETLEAGRDFSFEVHSDNARLLGGAAWGTLLRGNPQAGLADAFTRDWRSAAAYAGLTAMGADAASAVVRGTGLQAAASRYAELLWLYADAFRVSNGAAIVPGGAPAEDAWSALAGANPHTPAAFFRALLDKDRGGLLSFYYLLARADAAHQRFFTQSPARAQRFYAWYRDSGEVILGKIRATGAWRAEFLSKAPLDAAGHIYFPGGAGAWTNAAVPSDDVLPAAPQIAALVPVARVEQQRHAPLDADSAALLANHYADWREIFPYFERLPGLGKEEFQALAAFAAAVQKQPPSSRNSILGQWHSLVELLVLSSGAGSLDAPSSAHWFRLACERLSARDAPATLLDTLRAISRAGNLDDGLVNLLRLDPARRAAFDEVRALQRIPRLDSLTQAATHAQVAAALSGFVYAALLQPGQLLVMEEPGLPLRHQFVRGESGEIFPRSELVVGPSSYFAGGFMGFAEEARRLAIASAAVGGPADAPGSEVDSGGESRPAAAVSAASPGPPAPEAVFRTSARLVEIYATVTEGPRYVDDLERDQFRVLDAGAESPVAAFESRASGISCALLLDTTGSMQAALPILKSTAMKLIAELRPIDSVAIYTFSDRIHLVQPFTTDKTAAQRAVLGARAFGKTALYNAIVRVNRDLAGRGGKKALIVFTDGADNLSELNGDDAIRRAKTVGVPVYTIALGEAMQNRELVRQLGNVAKSTGGEAFLAPAPSDIPAVFANVARDLTHGYLLAIQPRPGEDDAWRSLEVVLKSPRGRKVRAREGYYPD